MEQHPELPTSPAMGQVQLRECIEELLRFTLVSAIDGTLEFDMGLSKNYCSRLLQDDPGDPSSFISDSSEGVLSYPLYKHLASALYQSITSGAFNGIPNNMAMINDENSLKLNEDWNELIVNKGSELVNILKTINFELHVQEPFFSQLKGGLKTVEGRCAVGDYNRIKTGDLILFNKSVVLEVQDVHQYASFSDMLQAESLAKVLPGASTIEEGVQIYRKFYNEEKERSNGVLAICVAKPAAQPSTYLACILSGLNYWGAQRLLGFGRTTGTCPEALPPPRSALYSSFMLPNKPNVNHGILTEGARALAKHVNRSNRKWWGCFKGSDSIKNSLARDVISHLIAYCCWLNMHIVPPHGIVFEIRIAEGYGARWSEDGSKFIGFLEPYMKDGHSKSWKH